MSIRASHMDFLGRHHSAAMITIGPGGIPKVARVGVCLVDGKLWSSGTAARLRTRRLRSDPRCTLYVFDTAGFGWLALETAVTILEGPEAPGLSVRLFRAMQGKPDGPLAWFGRELTEEEFRAVMVAEERLIYEFTVHHAYGMG